MINTLNDFIEEFEKVKAMGWIKTHRAGPTGIGKTLEDLLGIPENNLDEPDFGDYELKSCRIDSGIRMEIARCLLPDIIAYYESEQGQKEFAEWKKAQNKTFQQQDKEKISTKM